MTTTRHPFRKKALSVLLTFLMVFGNIGVLSTLFMPTAYATTTGLTLLPGNGNSGYYGGDVLSTGRYYISANTTIKAKNNTEYNGLLVDSSATVLVYIPAGVTLTCIGGDGSGTSAGQGGFYLR
ncbi:MAG: hypothetical protein IK118_10290, partial [Clostridia bacterium]|nr:hypothetical protein [Clostridia bacterium]